MKAGNRLDLSPALRDSIGLVLTEVALGNHFDKNSADFKSIVETMETGSQVCGVAGILNYLPWLR